MIRQQEEHGTVGQFAQGLQEAEAKPTRCVVGRLVDNFDDDDRSAFDRLLDTNRLAMIRTLLGAGAPSDKALRAHKREECVCNG